MIHGLAKMCYFCKKYGYEKTAFDLDSPFCGRAFPFM